MNYEYYNKQSLSSLYQILEYIDKEKYPERVLLLKQAISEKGGDPEEIPDVYGIGGWLILPIIGLVISLFVILKYIFVDVYPVISSGNLFSLFNPSHPAYNPAGGGIFVVEVSINIVVFWLALSALFYCYKRSKRFVYLVIAFYLVNILGGALNYVALMMYEALQAMEGEIIKGLIQSVVVALIWIPYFIRSKRVRNTFGPA